MATYQIFAVLCALVLFQTVASLKCYKCEVSNAKSTDNCLKVQDTGTVTGTCIKGISKCQVLREVDHKNNNSIHFKRGCHGNVLGLGAKNECKISKNVETCTTVCDNKDLCNGEPVSDFDKCAKKGEGCSAGSLPVLTKFVFIGALAAAIKLYF